MTSTVILSDNGASSGSAGLKSQAGNDGVLILQTTTSGGTATNAIYVNTSQNVGIGITPTYKFDTSGTGVFGSAGGITLTTATNTVGIRGSSATTVGSAALHLGDNYDTTSRQWAVVNGYSAQGALNFLVSSAVNTNPAVSGSVAMTLDASGNLGVGTTSPGSRLHITGSNGLFAQFLNSTNSTGEGIVLGSGSSLGRISTNGASTAMAFEINATEKARIDSSGQMLIGTTTASSTYGLRISSTRGINLIGWGNGRGEAMQLTAHNTSNADVIYFDTSAANVGKIAITSTATSYVTSSDYRLKENIAPMTGALAKVATLKPCTYTWKSNGEAGEGFIAHELQEVVPHAVTGEKDEVKEDGTPLYQGIDTSFLVATLTAAIQEQQAIITQLQADVAALKGA